MVKIKETRLNLILKFQGIWLCPQNDSICLGHTLAHRNLYCRWEFWLIKCIFADMFRLVLGSDHLVLNFDLQVSWMPNTVLNSLLVDTKLMMVHLKGIVAPKMHFTHIWSCCDLHLWVLDLSFSDMLYTVAVSFFEWKMLLPGLYLFIQNFYQSGI